MNRRTPEAYREYFERFCTREIPEFFKGLGEAYIEMKWNPDSMIYFRNHFSRFWAMIQVVLQAGIEPAKACELGSFYPYTTLYFGCQTDLYDIVSVVHPSAKPYSHLGISLHGCNFCTDPLPNT